MLSECKPPPGLTIKLRYENVTLVIAISLFSYHYGKCPYGMTADVSLSLQVYIMVNELHGVYLREISLKIVHIFLTVSLTYKPTDVR